MMKIMCRFMGLLLVLSLLGCTSADVGGGPGEGLTGPDLDCATDEIKICLCEDGSDGEQICLGEGQGFGVCLCDDPTGEDTVEDPSDVVETDDPPLCISDDECDDGIPCTVDACKDDGCHNILPAGYCVIEDSCVSAGTPNPDNPCEACDPNSELYSWKAQHDQPCDDGDPCTTNDACDKDVCRGELLDCDDGLFCNGQELCDGDLGCIPGETPILDDAVACTVDVCDELTQSVTHSPDDALCFPSDPCSVAACDPVDGCYNVPLPTCCGNGIVEPGEACDDGNDDEDDDCTATCEETSDPPPGEPGCPDGMISVLSNAGFETGDFAPWTSNGADTWVVNDAFEGSWAAETNGNFHVAQDFPPVPVPHLAMASFWTWHEPGAGGIMSVSWSYGDGSTDSTFLNSDELEGWNQVHLLPLMDPTKELSGITTWGYAGGGPEPDISRFDSYQFCLGDGDVCFPQCQGKTCGEDGCGGSCGECDGGPETCLDGQCLCVPDCGGATCGDDGCGGSCGECTGDAPLCVQGTCAPPPPDAPGCEGGDISILHNPDFEDGVTDPWTSNGDITLVNDAFEGSWAAQTEGNFHVAQSFPPVPVLQLTSATFWTWHDAGDNPAMSVEWTYSDGSTGSAYVGTSELDGWVMVDVLDDMDPAQELVEIRTWGYAGGGATPDITRYDSYQFCRGGGDPVCEPDCAGATCGDDGCGGSCGQCAGGDGFCVDGVCADAPDATETCADGGISVLDNPGFEDGVVEPWTSNGVVSLVEGIEGVFAAEVDGNVSVSQDFEPVPVSLLSSARFWTWHAPGSGPAMSISWGYSDGSNGSTGMGGAEIEDWSEIDLLPLMDPTKDLVSIQAWGYSGGSSDPDLTRFDAFEFCLGP